MNWLDREGIFKATPIAWRVKKFDNKLSVAIAIDFVITAQLDGSDWTDWSGYEEHQVSGDFWVVKKDGQPNVKTVETLSEVLGWRGSLSDVVTRRPPEVVVQITVKGEEYQGKTYYKVQWLNPEDYTPTPQGASEAEVKQLDARFGSLLRAAAGGKARPPAKPPARPQPKPAREDPRDAEANFDEVPF